MESEFSSISYKDFGMASPNTPLPRAYFRPRPLENLLLAEELESLDAIIDSRVLNLLPNSDIPQIFTVCGRGPRSTYRMLRHGLDVEETVSSDLPGIPNAVWTTKIKEDGKMASLLQQITLLRKTFQIHTTHILFFLSSMVLLFCRSVKPSKKSRTLVFFPQRPLLPFNK